MSNENHNPLAPMADEVMSAEDEAELLRLLSFDSANIPGTESESVAEEHQPPRSKYFGVYNNTGTNSDKFAFRSALGVRGKGGKHRWINLGYFNCEIVAAMAYNVAAINTFGKGAWLNPVSPADADVEEFTAWKAKRAEHIETATAKIKELQGDGVALRYVDLDKREADINATA